jgi:hypothetical protein
MLFMSPSKELQNHIFSHYANSQPDDLIELNAHDHVMHINGGEVVKNH